MSAVPSNTGGLGAHDGAPPAGPHPNASPPRHREGGMVDYRGPAPETPSPTFHGKKPSCKDQKGRIEADNRRLDRSQRSDRSHSSAALHSMAVGTNYCRG